MKKIFIFFFSFLCLVAGAQVKDSLAVKYANTITAADLKKHLTILASDEYEGRETGKEGQKKAAKYIAEQFKNSGIPPMKDGIYSQPFEVYPSISLNTTIKIESKEYKMLQDFYYFKGTSFEAIVKEEIIFAGYGINDKTYDDYKNTEVKDKVILMFDNEPYDKDSLSLVKGKNEKSKWTKDYTEKTEEANKRGAKAVLYVVDDFDYWIKKSKHFFESPSLSLEKPDGKEMPVIFITKKMADDILSGSKKLKNFKTAEKIISEKKEQQSETIKEKITVDFKQSTEPMMSENVIGYIEGSDLKEQLIFVTAHYDHLGIHDGKVYNGADDDGSGTVSVIEIAEAFMKAKKEGHGPRRSVVVMTVAGEEKGLLGSKYYVANPIFPLEKTVCDLNIDMVGRVDEKHKDSINYIYLIGSNMLSSKLHEVSEQCNKTYSGLALDYLYDDPKDKNRFYYRSDHYNFAKNNIPVIFYFNGTHADYHKETDEVDKINFDLMEKRARLVFFTAWTIANMDEKIVVDKKPEEKKEK